jgi:hypothetical protein
VKTPTAAAVLCLGQNNTLIASASLGDSIQIEMIQFVLCRLKSNHGARRVAVLAVS